ncbi:MAG TPA: bifunctional diaminohydroxyphosphoribosylaminopyrimidine deaminase/5-amino-6-(5-phosphoribosylamino)uracil reductase RibD [Gelria sp.]|jgi:diaminohydroxyphosphoribosylaminopyrimidine deaminase/5-amino-6-(5-phosphoribosylamino)uracil reductase|nr:bifunctional diaminohydroxyphosphoribosylaminopyrimidine deaminase/5-amino-6-(5-phosphoribosylamino)uracil reductase RibD [Gelria sp.]
MRSNMDKKYMQKALDLAIRALGRTSPNPMVGAVVVKDDQVVGEGYHMKAGTPHAEIHALQAAGDNARGATLYVNLEPCSHYGKTPPCADAIVKAGVKRVVVAGLDTNPQVSGRGLKILQDAGIETYTGVLEQEAWKLNLAFFKYIQTGMPLVSLKVAMTLDGKIATSTGDSRWISSAASRKYVHQLRNVYDAIMVGIGTVLQDDPKLNTRLEDEDSHDPIRVIIDSKLELPRSSNIVKTARQQKTLVFCGQQADTISKEFLEEAGLTVIRLASNEDKLPLEEVLRVLGEMEIMTLLVEGGGEINGYLIEKGLIDKVYWFIAPKIVGGRAAPTPVGGRGIPQLKDALQIKSMEIERFNQDILITGYIGDYAMRS